MSEAIYQLMRKRTTGSGLLYYMTEEQEKKFKELYPVHTDKEIAEWFGIGITTMRKMAKELSLVKDRHESFRLGGIRNREKWRKERLRVKYGLEQKTNLNVPFQNMSRKAVAQKYAMIKDCDYFPAKGHPSWVCYDGETKRSRKREATAEKHGLKIIEAD